MLSKVRRAISGLRAIRDALRPPEKWACWSLHGWTREDEESPSNKPRKRAPVEMFHEADARVIMFESWGYVLCFTSPRGVASICIDYESARFLAAGLNGAARDQSSRIG